MSRRILRVKIDALTPGVKTYCTWNPADKNANITLSGGDLTASSVVATAQAVRGTQSFAETKSYYFEVTWNSGSNIYIGIGNASASLSQFPGNNANSWSVANTGLKWNNASSSSYTTSFTTGATVGVLLRWNRSSNAWNIYFRTAAGVFNQSIFGGVAYSSITGTLLPMIGSTSAFNATVNFGASPFVYDIPDGALPGVWTQAADTSTPIYLASESYVSHANSTPASSVYEGRLMLTPEPTLNRTVSVWPWGSSNSGTSIGDLVFHNEDGELDYFKDLTVRDRTVTLEHATGAIVDYYNNDYWLVFAIGVADRFDFQPNRTVKLVLSDKMLIVDKPLNEETFPVWLQEETLRDSSKPVCIGTAYSCDAPKVEPNLQYFDVHDDAIWGIVEIRDQGDLDVLTTDYSVRNTGFAKVHPPAGKVTAAVQGAVKRGTLLFNEDFTSWSAGAFDNNPTGWTVSGESSSNERVYERTSGRCALKKSGGGSILSMEKNASMVAGTTYVVTINVTYFSGTSLKVRTSNGAGSTSAELFSIDTTKRDESHSFLITPTAGQSYIQLYMPASSTAQVEIENLTIHAASHITNLPDFVEELLVTRGGLTTADIDTTSLTNLNTQIPYSYGFFSSKGGGIRNVLNMLTDSFCGWVIPNYDGELTFGRLKEPSPTSVLTLTKYVVQDDLTCVLDRAKNLTTTIGAKKNWSKHGDNDIAGSVSSAVSEELKADMRVSKSMPNVVDNVYNFADGAKVKETLFSESTNAEYEAERLANLYRTPRYFYELSALLDLAEAIDLNPGDTVTLKYPRFDLAAGKNLLVAGIMIKFNSNVVKLKLWG